MAPLPLNTDMNRGKENKRCFDKETETVVSTIVQNSISYPNKMALIQGLTPQHIDSIFGVVARIDIRYMALVLVPR